MTERPAAVHHPGMAPALLLAFTLLAGCILGPAAQARTRALPERNCGTEMNDGKRSWRVEDLVSLSAQWSMMTDHQAHIMSFVWLREPGEIAAYGAGARRPQATDTIYFAPGRPIPPAGAWLILRGNGLTIGPIHYGERKRGSGAVKIAGDVFFGMVAGADDLTMIVQQQDGAVLHQERIASSLIRDTDMRLRPLVREVEAKRQDRENRCGEVIIMTH